MYTMSDYKSKTHSIYLNTHYAASSNLSLFGTFTFARAEASLDEVIMPDVTARLVNPDIAGGVDLTHFDLTYEEMPTYSDFNYDLINLSLGLNYRITPTVTFTTEGKYSDLTDDAGYVYGNESGSYVVVSSGIRFEF